MLALLTMLNCFTLRVNEKTWLKNGIKGSYLNPPPLPSASPQSGEKQGSIVAARAGPLEQGRERGGGRSGDLPIGQRDRRGWSRQIIHRH